MRITSKDIQVGLNGLVDPAQLVLQQVGQFIVLILQTLWVLLLRGETPENTGQLGMVVAVPVDALERHEGFGILGMG